MVTNPVKYLFDTCVFIDYLRGPNYRPQARAAWRFVQQAFNGDINAGISPITDLELWCGVRDRVDEKRHKQLLSRFRRYQFNTSIARRSGELFKPYILPTAPMKPSIPDIILVATAEYYNCTLLTSDTKHIPLFNGLVTIQQY